MGCIVSVCGIPKYTESEKHVVLRTSDSLTLMVRGRDKVRSIPLRKSLEVVVVERRNSKGNVRPNPFLVQQNSRREHR